MLRFLGLLAVLGMFACANGRNTISQRPLVDATRGDGSTAVEIREIEQPRPPHEFYVKNKELKVKPVRKQNASGSLSSVDDARSYVLPTMLPIAVGTILDIKTTSNRLDTPASTGSLADTTTGAPAEDKSSAQLEQTLLKAVPQLEPGSANDKPTLVKNFKVQVIDVKDNGDVVVAYHRRSLRADQASDLLINATIPYAALTDRDNITTAKLENVKLTESEDGEVIERISANWEDEYTLRISGFDEAKSKSALALEEQRRQLGEAREKVVAQIKSLGTERNTMTKERQGLLDAKKKDDEKISELEAKLKEQAEQIEKLTPKEENSDANLTDAEKAAKDQASADAAAKDNADPKKADAKKVDAKKPDPKATAAAAKAPAPKAAGNVASGKKAPAEGAKK